MSRSNSPCSPAWRAEATESAVVTSCRRCCKSRAHDLERRRVVLHQQDAEPLGSWSRRPAGGTAGRSRRPPARSWPAPRVKLDPLPEAPRSRPGACHRAPRRHSGLIERPRPRPPNRRPTDDSPCSKASKRRGRNCGSIPMPVSATSDRQHDSAVPARVVGGADRDGAAVRR